MENNVLNGKWQGWLCCGQYLIDQAGNKYSPEDVNQCFYGRQLYKELTGNQFQIRTLKGHLKQQLEKDKAYSPDHSSIIQHLIYALQRSIA